jgi:dynactin 1
LGERELGYALSFDRDLDMFAASIGLTKTSVGNIVKDDGADIFFLHRIKSTDVMNVEILLDMGGYDIETELFRPLQSLLDQCKGAKSLSKYVTLTSKLYSTNEL